MDILIWTSVLLAVVITAVYVGGVYHALGIRFRKPRTTLKREDEVHPVLAPFFRATEEFLFSEGFRLSHCQMSETMEYVSYPLQWEKVYLHPGTKVYAIIRTAHQPEEALPADIMYISSFSDGSRLLTMNCLKHTTISDIPSAEVIDPYSESMRDVLQAHLKRLEELRGHKTPVVHDPASFIKAHVSSINEHIDSLVAKGLMRPAGNGLFRLTFSGAIRFVRMSIKGAKHKAKVLNKARKRLREAPHSGPDVAPPLPLAVEVQAFLRTRSLNERLEITWTSKAVLFFCTSALFLAAGSVVFGVLYTVSLLSALIVHELGHALGMRIFGYRNIKVVLLPMMGAVTTGLPRGVKRPWQEAVIFLMGPVPGLVIGAGLIVCSPFIENTTYVSMLSDAGMVFIVLNALNLLPVMPLDGGRLVNLLLLSRSPLLQSVFLVMSMLAAGAGAYYLREPVLGFLALLLLVMSRKSFQYGRSVRALRAGSGGDRRGEGGKYRTLFSIFRLLREKPFRDLPFAQKIRAAQVLQEAAFGPRPAIITSLVFMGFYASLFIVPFVLLSIHLVSGLTLMPTREYLMNPEFRDGLRLTYSMPGNSDQPGGSGTVESTYTIRKAVGEEYAYSFTNEYSLSLQPPGEGAEYEGNPGHYDQQVTYLNSKGKVLVPHDSVPDMPARVLDNLFYPLFWVPASEVQPGDPLFGYCSARQVERLFGRDLLPVVFYSNIRYYDLDTGFLVFEEVADFKGVECTAVSWLSGSNDERLKEVISLINEKVGLQKDMPAKCLTILAEPYVVENNK